MTDFSITISNTYSPNTVIASAQVNTGFQTDVRDKYNSAFSSSTGHTHDGTTGNAAPIVLQNASPSVTRQMGSASGELLVHDGTLARTYLHLASTGKTITGANTFSGANNFTGVTTIDSTDFHILSSGAAFDLILAVATVFTADRTLTLDIGDASRSLTLTGNLSMSGAFSLTHTLTGATNVTYPTTGTLATLAGSESLSNKTIAAPVFSGTATGTYTLGGTPTISAPVLSGTVTGTYTLGGTPTLSGTFAGTPTFSGAATHNAPLIGMQDKGSSGAGTVTCDCAVASKFLITATGNFTLAFSNFTNGQRVEVWILQDGTGTRVPVWPTATRWLNGTGATDSTTDKPTLTTTINKFDVIYFEKFDAVGTDGNIYGFVKGFKGAIT